MRISKNKTLYSPTDLNNFVSCKYHIKNDLTANDLGLKKKEKSADLKLRIEYGKEHEKEYFRILSKKALTPNKKEINQNIRSRSAKLRYAIRNNNSFFYQEEFKKKFENYFKMEEIRL